MHDQVSCREEEKRIVMLGKLAQEFFHDLMETGSIIAVDKFSICLVLGILPCGHGGAVLSGAWNAHSAER